MLQGDTDSHREDAASAMHNWRMIRTDRYKAIINYGADTVLELYDLQEDPRELHNIAQRQPELAGELSRRCMERYLQNRWHR